VGCGSSSTGTSARPSPAPVTCAAIYQALGLGPSVVADSDQHGQCVLQHLQVSGEVSGQILVGHLQDLPERNCSKPGLGQPFSTTGLRLDVLIASKPYVLLIRPPGKYLGQQTTSTSDVAGAVTIQVPTALADYVSTTGTMTVEASGHAGTMNVDLKRDVVGATPVHVKGDWSCGPPPAQPTPDASVPCSAYFAAANLPPGTVDPKSVPCLPQDLTFSGGLSFHVKEAVNLPGTGGPSCGGLTSDDQQNYSSKQSFAGGGFEYDLSFTTHNDLINGPLTFPDFGPTYTTASGSQAPTLTLTTGAVTWSSTAGKYSVAADHRSGTVNMDLVGGLSTNQAVHVSGSWRCT
jgi:hypothetical protein